MRKVGNQDILNRYAGAIQVVRRYAGATLVWESGSPSPQNLALWSEQLDNAVYAKARVTVTADSINDPDELLTADLILETAVDNTHTINQNFDFPTMGAIYTFSVFAKAQDRNKLRMNITQGADGVIDFDLIAKTANKVDGIITELTNGWFRCSVTRSVVATGSRFPDVRPLNDSGLESYLGDVTKGIYLWGWQINEGSLRPYTKTEESIVP